jgi:hypothetical protein
VKTFYSAEDIEALVARGQTELIVDEDTVLTQLARDTAQHLGLRLVRGSATPPGSSRPATVPSSTGRAASLGVKPRGCQHGPLPGRPSAPAPPSGSTDKVVGELVDLVRQLGKGSEG